MRNIFAWNQIPPGPYTGPIEIGMTFVWRDFAPKLTQKVLRTGNNSVLTKIIDPDILGVEFNWTDEARFRAACWPAKPGV